jgi:hypothetical protein
LRAVLLQWNDPKHTRNHRFRLIGNQDLSMFFNALQVYGRKLANDTSHFLDFNNWRLCVSPSKSWSLAGVAW